MRTRGTKWRLWAAVLVAVASCRLAAAGQQGLCVTRSVNLCDFKTDLDGQWEGSIVASDGCCYFASSTHSGRTGAMFFKFDPRTQKVTPLCMDISVVCGEDPTKNAPQGKIHSDVDEMDGWLYFGAHASYHARPYTGAHMVGYEMKTGKFRDFGVMEAGYSNYAGLAADPKHKCVYIYLVWPGQRNDRPCPLYRVDVKTGRKQKVAHLPAGGYDAAVYYMYCDRDGNLWLPAQNGVLARYDGRRHKLEMFPGALPTRSDRPFRQWEWSQPIPGKNMAVVTTHDSQTLSIFNPEAKVGRFRTVAEIGRTHLSVAVAGEVVYFIQREDISKRYSKTPEHLKAINFASPNPRVIDYGRITDQGGRRPMRIPALAADGEGRVYMTGDWYAKGGDTRTTRLKRDRSGRESYPQQGRCQRFAYVKVQPPK